MLLLCLWIGQTALTESELVLSLALGSAAVSLACFGGSILAGVVEPEAIPDEQMSSLASLVLGGMLVTGETTCC
jgi:hypothetical protein